MYRVGGGVRPLYSVLIERNCSRINLGCKTVMVHLTEIILINSFQSKLIVLKISRGFLILIVYD